MKPDKLTNEFLTSADWDEIVGLEGNFTLGVGYCYLLEIKEIFKKNHKNYHFFDVKWGRCGTTYLFSALRPSNIIVLTAWSNSAVLCEKTSILFKIWREILLNLSSLNVNMMIFDTPAAWHRSEMYHNIGATSMRSRIKERKKIYFDEVVQPSLINNKTQYIDLNTIISEESLCITENANNIKSISSPWHLSKNTLEAIAQYFIDTNNNSTTQNLSDTIKSLESTAENKC